MGEALRVRGERLRGGWMEGRWEAASRWAERRASRAEAGSCRAAEDRLLGGAPTPVSLHHRMAGALSLSRCLRIDHSTLRSALCTRSSPLPLTSHVHWHCCGDAVHE